MSEKANKLIVWMVKEISAFTHAPKDVIEGCYDAAILNYNFAEPEEGKEVIIAEVMRILRDYV